MRYELTRAGGLAGLVRTVAIVDTNDLRPERASELEGLLRAARFWELPEDPAPAEPMPDAVSYELTVSDGARRHAVSFDARSGSRELLALVSAVRAAAKT